VAPLTIDIVSDVVCPWCYLGKRRLEAALAKIGREDAVVRWRPFQLDETIPPEGMDRQTYMRGKFGDLSRISAVHERLLNFGEEVGAVYDFDAIARAPNTLKAHRLIRWAGEARAQDAVVDLLFKAYFEEGKDIGDDETLVEIAAAGGMDGEDVRRRLQSEVDVEAARGEMEAWRRAGVTGVPFFIFEGKLAVSGAQTVDVLASAMIEAENHPAAREPAD
jgi:predicted DsbA family dithiol-disulfide isomerase